MSGTGKSNSAASDAAVDSRSVAASSQASSISGISAGPSSTAMPPRGTSTLGDSSRASVWGSATCSAAAATGDLSGPRGGTLTSGVELSASTPAKSSSSSSLLTASCTYESDSATTGNKVRSALKSVIHLVFMANPPPTAVANDALD